FVCLSISYTPVKRQIKQQEPSAEADGSYQMADLNSVRKEDDKHLKSGIFVVEYCQQQANLMGQLS
ncbi:hypothetical protein, partial [Anaerostipes sp.]|uniref:hypothetical protein n=1 Tax=Anaerostipes sp. TaxID=1872530 RepID=UPI002583ADA6